jgi:hypothetical protein
VFKELGLGGLSGPVGAFNGDQETGVLGGPFQKGSSLVNLSFARPESYYEKLSTTADKVKQYRADRPSVVK